LVVCNGVDLEFQLTGKFSVWAKNHVIANKQLNTIPRILVIKYHKLDNNLMIISLYRDALELDIDTLVGTVRLQSLFD
jgi:hypothetical protein